jgi:hypothetical protein
LVDKFESDPDFKINRSGLEKKGSNWSAIVRGGLPTEQPVQQQQPVAAAKPAQSRPNQKKKTENNQANGTHEGKLI